MHICYHLQNTKAIDIFHGMIRFLIFRNIACLFPHHPAHHYFPFYNDV